VVEVGLLQNLALFVEKHLGELNARVRVHNGLEVDDSVVGVWGQVEHYLGDAVGKKSLYLVDFKFILAN
jgi:hypothetical protein